MAGMKHLTGGPIGRQLIALSAPLLMGNILQQLYNTIDAVIVGRFVGDSAFGAVGVAGSVMNLFLFLISGGCDGVGTLLSQIAEPVCPVLALLLFLLLDEPLFLVFKLADFFLNA